MALFTTNAREAAKRPWHPPERPTAFPRPNGYDCGMTKVAKITISLPREQVEQVRTAVAGGEAASVSGYVSAALADALAVPDPGEAVAGGENSLAELVEELIREHGEPSAEAYAWADAALAPSDRP